MKKNEIEDIYRTKISIEITASDYFRLNLLRKNDPQMPDVDTSISLDYKDAKKMYKILQKYLKERDLID